MTPATCEALEEEAQRVDTELADAHTAKVQRRRHTLEQAIALCDERSAALREEDPMFVDAQDRTQAEMERDETQALQEEQASINRRLEDQLKNLKNEAASQDAEQQARQQLQTAEEAFAAQIRDLKEAQDKQLAEMQRNLAAAQQQAKCEESRAKALLELTLAFEKTTRVTLADLPEINPASNPPAGDHLTHLGQLHHLLTAWMQAGAVTPFTFQDLVDNTCLAQGVCNFVKSAMGSSWERWFPAEPPLSTVVPRQVAELLLASLQRLDAHWRQQGINEEISKQGLESYTAVVGVAKRRRAALLEAAA